MQNEWAFDRELELADAELAARARTAHVTAAAIRRHLDRTARALGGPTPTASDRTGPPIADATLQHLAGALETATSVDRVRALRRAFARLAHPDLGLPPSAEPAVGMAEFNAQCDLALTRLQAAQPR